MEITEIADSHISHGDTPEIISTCLIRHEIAFKPGDVVELLKSCASDSMAKVINEIGENFNLDQMAECYAVGDLNDAGRQFIDDMYYFINSAR